MNSLLLKDIKKSMLNKGWVATSMKYPDLTYDCATAIAQSDDRKLETLGNGTSPLFSVSVVEPQSQMNAISA